MQLSKEKQIHLLYSFISATVLFCGVFLLNFILAFFNLAAYHYLLSIPFALLFWIFVGFKGLDKVSAKVKKIDVVLFTIWMLFFFSLLRYTLTIFVNILFRKGISENLGLPFSVVEILMVFLIVYLYKRKMLKK